MIHGRIALGGTNIPSPYQRYEQTRATINQENQNRLTQQAQSQNQQFRANEDRRSQGRYDQNRQAQQAITVAKDLRSILSLPEDQQEESYKSQVAAWSQQGMEMAGAKPWNAFEAKTMSDKVLGVSETFSEIKDEGGNIVAQRSSKTNRAVSDPRAPTKQVTYEGGQFEGTKSQKGKRANEQVENRARLEKQLRGYDYIDELVSDPDFVGGTSGKTLSLINSASAQYRQLTGDPEILTDGNVDVRNVDPKSKLFSRYRKSSRITDKLESVTIELAYLIAKTNDPGGRVTDKDYEAAKSIIGSTSDVKTRSEILGRLRNETIKSYNDREGIRGRNFQSYTPDLYRSPKKKQVESVEQTSIDDLLKKYGN